MNGTIERATLGRVTLQAELELLSGTRIGGPQEALEIGGIDNLILRDPLTGEPYLSGSSLKGKSRSILEKDLIGLMERGPHGDPKWTFNRATPGGGNLILYRHECDNAAAAQQCPVCRLFGSSGKAPSLVDQQDIETASSANGTTSETPATNFPAKLIIRDAFLTLDSRQQLARLTTELPYAEWKAENTLDRVTGAAMPRQMERAARGSKFGLTMIYRIENAGETLDPDVLSDLYNLMTVLSQLQEEGIGGSTSRGYGAVEIRHVQLSFTHKVPVSNGHGHVHRIRKAPAESLHLATAMDRLTWLVEQEIVSNVYEERFMGVCQAMRQWIQEQPDDHTACLDALNAIDEALFTLGGDDTVYTDYLRRRSLLQTIIQMHDVLAHATVPPKATPAFQGHVAALQTALAPVLDCASDDDDWTVLQRIFRENGPYQQELDRVYQRPVHAISQSPGTSEEPSDQEDSRAYAEDSPASTASRRAE